MTMILSDRILSEADNATAISVEMLEPERSALSVHANRCEAKVAYLTKDEAKRVRHGLSKAEGKKYGIYQCPNCHCFHFTSQKGL